MRSQQATPESDDIVWRTDVMITDPPYDERVYAKASSLRSGAMVARDLGHDPISDSVRDWVCTRAARARRWSCIFTDVESVGAWRDGLTIAGAAYIRAIPWVRWSMPCLAGDRPPQACEMVVIAYGYGSGRKHWNGPGNLTHFDEKCLRGSAKHPCEKPLDLALRLVEYFSDDGEIVADPFSGSGTIPLAAKLLGRVPLWNEMDPEWARKGLERVYGQLSERDIERMARNEGRMQRDRKAEIK